MEISKLLGGLQDNLLNNIFCSLVGKITKIHDENKIDVKPLYSLNGNSIPQVVQVPLLFLGNAKNMIEVESQVGDYVLLIISDYDIDNLIISGEEKEVNTNSKHQLNDAVAIPFSFTPFNNSKAQTSKISIKADGSIIIDTPNTIKLGGNATEGVPLGDSLKSWIDNHTHNFSSGYSWTSGSGSGTISGTTTNPNSESPNTSEKVLVE